MELQVKNRVLCNVLFENNKNEASLIDFLEQNYELSGDKCTHVQKKLETFVIHFKSRFKESHFAKKVFYRKNNDWLEKYFVCTFGNPQNQLKATCSKGRPKKLFSESSARTKRKKVKDIKENIGEEGIGYIVNSTTRKKNAKAYTQETPLTSDEALALFIDLKLTQRSYDILRQTALAHGSKLFPSYKHILEAKKKCYPNGVNIAECSAEVKIQTLLDHTASRIVDTIPADQFGPDDDDFKLISKWGCDGSSGQSEYKQGFQNSTVSDANMFLISFVPVQLISCTDKILWENKQPSSTKYCRPIKFEFAQETKEKVLVEVDSVREQIGELVPTTIFKGDKILNITHMLTLTMIDGKVCQILTETASSSSCVICKAKPTEMNDLQKIRLRTDNENHYEYGLSTLHAWIRFMECILHLAYNLPFKKWSARTQEEKNLKTAEKKRIQEEFRQKLSLKIDFPKQGLGTSNDGNTARRFFSNAEAVAEITKVNFELIKRFSIILQVLASGKKIITNEFENFAFNTATLFVSEYAWFYMPSSVHKILLHGAKIIGNAILPIGKLSEEAQEARNKDYKSFRLYHSRKFSRVATNEDIMHMLLISSDPIITSKRHILSKKKLDLHPEALKLILD